MVKAYKLALIMVCGTLSSYGQYSISGFISTEEESKTIYLSLLRFDEESMISGDQVLFTTKTDSSGYFVFEGKLLSKQNKLYRIHTNLNEESVGLQIYGDQNSRNYHNFIFSNADTLYFPKENRGWFSAFRNTNEADYEFRKMIGYEVNLSQEYNETQNEEALRQVKKSFFDEFITYCNDSINDPLVKLMGYARIQDNTVNLNQNFSRDPDFYYQVLAELKEHYEGTSYYEQFQQEISKLSSVKISQDYHYQRKMNQWLLLAVIVLTLALLLVSWKLRTANKKLTNHQLEMLTLQEKKVALMISNGLSNKEISSDLFVSLSTVKTHIRNLYAKMNVSGRKELIRKLKNHPRD